MFVLLLCLCTNSMLAQAPIKPRGDTKSKSFEPSERWALKTNALEWAATLPNFQVAYDWSGSIYNRSVLLLGVKYNWHTWHKYPTDFVFDVIDLRPEFRHYYRQKPVDDKLVRKGLSKFFSAESPNPKPWQARYIGAYVDYADFSLKPGSLGRQGQAIGLGVSYGRETPLYTYAGGVIDFELGISAGFLVTKYDGFRLDRSSYSYVADPGHSHGWHMLPYPVVSELRAVFSWRKLSVKDKYKDSDPSDYQYRLVLPDIKSTFASSKKSNFDTMLSGEKRLPAMPDSAYIAEHAEWLAALVQQQNDNVDANGNLNAKHVRKLKTVINSLAKSNAREFKSEVDKIIRDGKSARKKQLAQEKKEARVKEEAQKKAQKQEIKKEKKIKEKKVKGGKKNKSEVETETTHEGNN